MRRRSLLKLGALGTTAALANSLGANRLLAGPDPVRRVLLVTKCHLDVGFTETQQQVMRKYFEVYFPQAIRTAADLRRQGQDRYIWTTGSWLLYEYLEQAGPAERRAAEQAIVAGDLSWHALPFSWQTEMLTGSLIAGALGFSASLDRRFGRTTTGAKMTDVPGHSRGLIAPLQSAGVRLLDIGINAASTPPDVPDIFLWKDAGGHSLAMLYHRHDYGSVLPIPGTDVAVAVEVRNDNSGPHPPQEIAALYAQLRAQFPGATVQASTLNEVAAVVERVRTQLPVIHEEIGDTWIYGVASDPPKVARFREATRARQQWIDQGRLRAGEDTDLQMLRRLLLAAEHTWGTDTKTYLDNEHYRPADLAQVLPQKGYQIMQASWAEKRSDIDLGVATLPQPLRQELETRFDTLTPARPTLDAMRPHSPADAIDTAHFSLGLDPATGAITHLQSRATRREWAHPDHPLALFTYQSLSASDYAGFLDRYIKSKADWAPRDFGKPGIESFGALSRDWHPRLLSCSLERSPVEDRVLLAWQIEDDAAQRTGNVAWPRELFCQLRFPRATPVIELTVSTFGKVANRMPEAMWLTFHPLLAHPGAWSARKVDQPVALDGVVRGGGRSMHAIEDRLEFRDAAGALFAVETLDAPLVAVSGRSPLNFSLDQPDLSHGVHFCLYNNAWGTNYPQWAGGDWQFRFRLFAA